MFSTNNNAVCILERGAVHEGGLPRVCIVQTASRGARFFATVWEWGEQKKLSYLYTFFCVHFPYILLVFSLVGRLFPGVAYWSFFAGLFRADRGVVHETGMFTLLVRFFL